jgi:hypothetical protein
MANNTVTITKEQILQAIAEEPLKAGCWVTNDGCHVCAVGGVMRQVLNIKNTAKNRAMLYDAAHYVSKHGSQYGFASDGDFDAALLNSCYMTALSAKFENLCVGRHTQIDAIRKELAAWVTEHFPDSFEQDINGFKPLEVDA